MSTDLLTQLKALHLYGMAEAWSELRGSIAAQANAISGNHAEPADQRRNCRSSNAQPEIPVES